MVCRDMEQFDIRLLTKPAQRYIDCFETIAQFALLQISHATAGQKRYSFTRRAGTDNSATEADINKMFTTSWPMQVFLQLIAFWAHSHSVVLQPTHLRAQPMAGPMTSAAIDLLDLPINRSNGFGLPQRSSTAQVSN